MAADEVDFLFQALKILFDTTVLASDLTWGTERRREPGRQLHVQGQRAALLATDAQGPQQVQRADARMKLLRVGMAVGVEYALIAPGALAWGVKEIEHGGSP
ncbi:hypothetical protein D3C87_1355890 [compost metagenome]